MNHFFLQLLSKLGIIKIKNHSQPPDAKKPSQSVYEISLKSLNDKPLDLSQFKGKKILFVNTASECGYTPQYKGLQKLQDKFKDTLTVIGLPANNFGEQEPGSHTEIQSFCERNYGVTFPLTEKISVVGQDQHPLFQWLSKQELNGWNTKSPTWNFCKYLVSETGELMDFFSAATEPTSDTIINRLK